MFQVIRMKNQALFYSKDKSNKLKCHLLQFLCGALRVEYNDNVLCILTIFYVSVLV